jgi:hypothetical protein
VRDGRQPRKQSVCRISSPPDSAESARPAPHRDRRPAMAQFPRLARPVPTPAAGSPPSPARQCRTSSPTFRDQGERCLPSSHQPASSPTGVSRRSPVNRSDRQVRSQHANIRGHFTPSQPAARPSTRSRLSARRVPVLARQVAEVRGSRRNVVRHHCQRGQRADVVQSGGPVALLEMAEAGGSRSWTGSGGQRLGTSPVGRPGVSSRLWRQP